MLPSNNDNSERESYPIHIYPDQHFQLTTLNKQSFRVETVFKSHDRASNS